MEERSLYEKRIGTTLRGKWTLEKLLGVGGMAAVYVGVHKIGKREAIKVLHPEIARSKDLRDRFEQEAHAVNQFKHPGVVEIRDIDTSEDGAPFLVMELLEGENLSDRARRLNGLPIDELLRYIDELLDVLVAAHAQKIVHRDIKLDNLFIQSDGRLKVLDFGIARMRSGAKAMMTRTGATLGTVAYMPPEQVKGLEIDHRVDVFSVGATMYRVIAKRRIHDARNDPDLLVKMATEPAAPLSSVAPGTPPHLCMVVDRALAFHRERRYPDALTMQSDIRALQKGTEPPYAAARLSEGDSPGSKEPPAGTASVARPASAAFAEGATAATQADAKVPVSVISRREDPTAAAEPAAISRVAVPKGKHATEVMAAPLSAGAVPSARAPMPSGSVAQVGPGGTMPGAGYPPPPSVGATGPMQPPAGHISDRPMASATVPFGSDPPPGLAVRSTPPKQKSMAPILALGGAFLALGVGVGLWVGFSGSDTPEGTASAAPTGEPTETPAAGAAATSGAASSAAAAGAKAATSVKRDGGVPPPTGATAAGAAAAPAGAPAGAQGAPRPGTTSQSPPAAAPASQPPTAGGTSQSGSSQTTSGPGQGHGKGKDKVGKKK